MITKTATNTLFNQMSWPQPGERLNDVQWQLRYGTPNRTDILIAASVMHAYSALINKTNKDRNYISQILKQEQYVK